MNLDLIVSVFSGIPRWLATILISTLPIFELRGAVPVAIGIYHINPLEAYVLAVIGNVIPVIPLLLFLEPVSNYLRRYRSWDRFFEWLFTRAHHTHSESFERCGTIALALFVAVPLPVTGAWTGCAAAFVLGIQFKHALAAITAGILIAGIIVTTSIVCADTILSCI
ncbi:ligand-binding protein SH3 [Methanosarcinales archaeon ex4484_138]|nr:MAG: ligand-binding protein SH3 [Methanosarcinales archaeon ex4484_138]RLG23154.1 MAG: ligand-binding protein SH3 [Methanosarcinales archaeon]RLG28735.1 MAG: ligand-binding protein SH3 [Methanosarcinales archaeon]HHI30654.1 ligand-binding protein SH3 [Candidatus Methanoperedenaceae archaeon]